MTSALDHLVVAGTDLSAMVAWWSASSGQQPVSGGSHVGLGTRNALVGLGDAYLELIGPDPNQEAPRQARPFGIDSLAPQSIQLVTFALAVDDLDRALDDVAGAGIRFGEVQPMSRARPDGTRLEWRLSLPAGFDGVLPFLIEWGPGVEHPSASLPGGSRLESLVGHHPEADRITAALRAIDSPFRVEPASKPGLSATVDTPRGPVVL